MESKRIENDQIAKERIGSYDIMEIEDCSDELDEKLDSVSKMGKK